MEHGAFGIHPSEAAKAQLKATPELGKLKAASARIANATANVESFLDRFHGPQPPGATGPGAEITDNYRNDLETLFGVIERLENAVSGLSHIG